MIIEHAEKYESEGRSPLLIFPEGFCVNGRSLHSCVVIACIIACACRVSVQFQLGAFKPLVPVTPMALMYPWKHLEMATTVITNTPWFFYRCMCQFYNSAHLARLPTESPHPGEASAAFSERVRRILVEQRVGLQVEICSNHTAGVDEDEWRC